MQGERERVEVGGWKGKREAMEEEGEGEGKGGGVMGEGGGDRERKEEAGPRPAGVILACGTGRWGTLGALRRHFSGPGWG